MPETEPVREHTYVMMVRVPQREVTELIEGIQGQAAFAGLIVIEAPTRREAVNRVTDVLHEYRINHNNHYWSRAETWDQVNAELRRDDRKDYSPYV